MSFILTYILYKLPLLVTLKISYKQMENNCKIGSAKVTNYFSLGAYCSKPRPSVLNSPSSQLCDFCTFSDKGRRQISETSVPLLQKKVVHIARYDSIHTFRVM
ncbi:Piso0_005213 [Millerozyma farinosa CBS 7064]|uniref:Piso0_005213 protein n=1 Tax=Pichia sorbitophila (strain ATCC MYA-4447 / BCRC 22081 / CBS 7064 / NBRC 10061 / NRRL Y-12695) TaxID=559304 RepID=G8Y4I1_PICSO|nr:Piso0_005213 [Millerozyma farinosa CBS 7064]